MKLFLALFILTSLLACSSHPIKPEGKNVEVKREKPDGDCDDLGDAEGRVTSVTGKFEDALEDLKEDVALKGGNYIHLMTSSGMATAVKGRAYFCR